MTGRANPLVRRAGVLLAFLLFVGPLGVLLYRGVSPGAATLLSHLIRTVVPLQLGSSLLSSAGAALLGAALALGGVSCALFEFPGRQVLQRLMLVPLLVPVWFLAVIYRETLGFGGLWGLVVVLGVGGAPLFHLLGYASLRSVPRQYSEILVVLGQRRARVWARTLLPLSIPAFAAAGALVALLSWAEAAAARTLAVPTLTVGLLDQWYGREDSWVGASLGLLIAGLSLLLALQLWSVVRSTRWQDCARLGLQPNRRLPLRGVAGAVPWLLAAPQLAAGLVLPAVVIGSWTASRLDRVSWGSLGGDALRTLLIAAGATLGAALLAFPMVQAQATLGASRLRAFLARAPFAVFAVPPAVLALAVLSAFSTKAETGIVSQVNASVLPLLLALSLRYGAVFVAAGQASLLRQASDHAALLRVLGQSDWVSFLRLMRPFLAGPASAAAAFVFLEALKDVLLPVILQPFGFTTISSRLFELLQTQRLRDCAVGILCLGLLGLYPLFTLARFWESPAEDGRLT